MKIKNTILFLGILAMAISSKAQFIKEYYKAPGQNVRFAAVTPVNDLTTSNLYVAGNYGNYLFVGETQQNGSFLWSSKINVMDTSIIINSMIRDSDGNLVLAGTSITGDVGKAVVLKFNPLLKTLLWYQKANQNTFFWDIVEMGAGGDYVVGGQESFNGTGNGTDDITMTVNRSTGALNLISNLNKNVNETVEAVLYNSDSNAVYTTGRYELLSGTDKFRICITKMDPTGIVDWTRGAIKSTAGSGRFYSEDMIQDGDALLTVGSGDDAGTNSLRYLYLIKTTLNGTATWTNKYDISGVTSDGVFAGIKKYNTGYIIYGSLYSGTSYTDICLFNVDLSGNVLWAKSYPFRKRTPTTGLHCSGAMTVVGNYIFVVGEKKQPDGSLKGVFMRTPVSTGEMGACDNSLTILTTNVIAPYDGLQTLNPVTCSLTFMATSPTVKNQTVTPLTTCSANGLLMAPESETSDENIQFNSKVIEQSGIVISPNPGNGAYNVDLTATGLSGAEIIVTDISGNQVGRYKQEGDLIQVDISHQPSGMYFITVWDQNGIIVHNEPVIKQ